MIRRLGLTLTAAFLAVLLAVGASANARSVANPLNIYAAASLTEAFRALDPAQNYNFAGSNALEAQIRERA